MKPASKNSRSSIYRSIILSLISIALVFFTLLAYVVFSINRTQSEKIIKQCGNRASYIINRALDKSMLVNDNTELREIMHDLSKLSGLMHIDIYDQEGNLKHSEGRLMEGGESDDIAGLIERFKAEDDVSDFAPEPKYSISHIDDLGRVLAVYTPIMNEMRCTNTVCHYHGDDDTVLGLMQIKMSLSDIDRSRATSEINYFALVSVFILVSIIIMVSFIRQTVQKPLTHIVRASNEVANGNLDIRIPVDDFKDADISNMGAAFNNMLNELGQANKKLRRWSKNLEETVRVKTEEIKRTQEELLHIERMASLGKLSSSVAHEINNPLAGVLTYTKLISRLLKNESLKPDDMENIFGYLDMIESETKRCGNIVKGLLDFSRHEPSKFEIISLNQTLDEARTLMEHSFKVSQVEFETSFDARVDQVACNPNQIKQVCIAVLVNAIEAITRDGLVTFRSRNNDDSTEFIIEITDNGSGIRPEDKDQIFEPFFTRNKDGAGSGLGLAVTYGIVQRHNGKIAIDSELTKGTSFMISLPVYNQNERDSNAE